MFYAWYTTKGAAVSFSSLLIWAALKKELDSESANSSL